MKSILEMNNKGVMGQVVGTFVLVLIIAVVVGMTFLFVAQLKTNVSNVAGATSTAYKAVNDTEKAGSDLVAYLPMVFLALIFGVVLVVVLRVVLPYINIGGGI